MSDVNHRTTEKVLPLHELNRLRHQIYENGRGEFAYPP